MQICYPTAWFNSPTSFINGEMYIGFFVWGTLLQSLLEISAPYGSLMGSRKTKSATRNNTDKKGEILRISPIREFPTVQVWQWFVEHGVFQLITPSLTCLFYISITELSIWKVYVNYLSKYVVKINISQTLLHGNHLYDAVSCRTWEYWYVLQKLLYT